MKSTKQTKKLKLKRWERVAALALHATSDIHSYSFTLHFRKEHSNV